MTCIGFLIVFTCQMQPAPQIDVARFCKTARPISWSRADSEQTVKEIRAHNARGVRLCKWKAPKK